MKPLEPRPSKPRRDRWTAFLILATILMVVIWLCLYGLSQADIVSERTVLVIILIVAPVAAFIIMACEWVERSNRAAGSEPKWREVPPPADFTTYWNLQDRPLERSRRHKNLRQTGKRSTGNDP